MKKCPKCNNFSVDYDPYRKVEACMMDGCSCIVVNDSTYSYLKRDSSNGKVCRIEENGKDRKIVKEFILQV